MYRLLSISTTCKGVQEAAMLVKPTMSEKKIVTCHGERESVKVRSPGNSGRALGEFGDL